MNEAIGSESGGSATEQVSQKAQELAGQAQDKASELAAQARPKVDEAQDRVRGAIDTRTTQTGDQLRSVADAMRHTSEELRSRGNDPHAKVADQAAERLDRLGGYLTNASADDILADVEDLARRQPWAVAAGGLIIGLAAARFVKASSDRRYAEQRQRRTWAGNGSPAVPPASQAYPALPPTTTGVSGNV